MKYDGMEWWTGIATIVLAVIAFSQFWVQFYFSKKQSKDTREAVEQTVEAQRRISREEIAVRLCFTMIERFDSDRLQKSRKSLAYHLCHNGRNEQVSEDVLNFFEDLGSLFQQGRVDEHLTYDAFSYFAKGWWAATREYVVWVRAQKRDTSLFSRFESFAERMKDLETKERPIAWSQVALTSADVTEFLEEEYAVC